MTVGEAISRVDREKHNVYSEEDKRRWLYHLEHYLAGLTAAYTPVQPPKWEAFTPEYPLLVPEAYGQIYLRWLEYQIDYANQDYRRSNNALGMYRAEEEGYLSWLTRSGKPAGVSFRYW